MKKNVYLTFAMIPVLVFFLFAYSSPAISASDKPPVYIRRAEPAPTHHFLDSG